MSTIYTVVLQAASSHGNEHMVTLRRAASASEAFEKRAPDGNEAQAPARSLTTLGQSEKTSAPRLRNLVTEYFGPGQILREIYLASTEGQRFAIPITLAVQLSPLLKEFVTSLMTGSLGARGKFDFSDKKRMTIDLDCSTESLRTIVDYVTARMELDVKLSEEGIRMTDQQKKEHWRDYLYWKVASITDLDEFADDVLMVADYLSLSCLHELMKCCFRLRL